MADETLGPIGYLVVEFPDQQPSGEGLAALIDLVDRGLIRVLDLMFVSRDEAGKVSVVELTDVDGDGTLDLVAFEGVSSGLLQTTDAEEAANALQPGRIAAVLLYENRWAAAFTAALRKNGAELVAAGFIPLDDLAAALDAVGD